MSGFYQISSSAGPSQKCQFWVKFSTRLQISGCCHISSFTGPEWSKVSILSQMFDATENFWIVPNFILCMLWVVKNVSFELIFDTNQNFLILHNFILSRSGVVKLSISSQIFNVTENFWILPNFILCRSAVVKNCIFEPNFQHKSKFFLILQNFILCRSRVVKLSISSQIFNTTENSGFCQISSFTGLEWSKFSFLSEIFNTNQNFSGFCQISSFLVF